MDYEIVRTAIEASESPTPLAYVFAAGAPARVDWEAETGAWLGIYGLLSPRTSN